MNTQIFKSVIKNSLGDGMFDLLKDNGCYVAGGALTSIACNREINDLDIYFPSFQSLIKVVTEIFTQQKDHLLSMEYIVHHMTKKSLLLKNDGDIKVQFIHFQFFENVQQIFNTFDFTVCMAAYDLAEDEVVFEDDFMLHNSQRYLKFNPDTAFPIVSLLRAGKYQERGYTISKSEMLRIAMKCMTLNIDSYEELAEHIGGMYGIDPDELFNKDIPFSLDAAIEQLKWISDRKLGSEGDSQRFEFKSLLETLYQQHSEGFKKLFLKWVRKSDDGRYLSHYNPKFEYPVGEVVQDMNHGIYFENQFSIHAHLYSNYPKSVIIQLEPIDDDFESVNDTLCADRTTYPMRVIGEWVGD